MKRLCAALVVLCLVAGLLVAATASPFHRQQIDAQHLAIGRLLVDQVMLIRHWEAFEDNSGLLNVIQAMVTDFKSQDYEYLTIELPDRPITADGPKQSLDKFEQQLLNRFTRSTSEKSKSGQIEYTERLTANGTAYQYYRPIRVKRSCVKVCHPAVSAAGVTEPAKPFAEGDLMAVMRITIPMQPEP
jgi:Na+-transporting NADH:ubiquinone oxidoreductase subunit NqrC